jgi:fumarate reductase flavoprotein subunit
MAERFDAEYDVVVIGGGISGLSAALQAAKDGLTCALLEKEDKTGGSSAFAEGHAAFESDEQEKRGIHVGKVEAYERYLTYSHWRADPAVVSRFVEHAATSIVKLREELGVVYEGVEITAPDQPEELQTWHLPEGEIAHVIELQEAEARRRGVDIFLGTPARHILMDEGRVCGVAATDSDGRDVTLGAKAVVVATGGFAASPEKLDRYSKYDVGDKMINVGGPGNTGDGIDMVLEAGGVTNRNIGCLLLFPFMRDKAIVSHTNCAGMQPYLWVDKYGRRFTDETVALNFGHAGDMVAGLPGAFFWSILGQEAIRHLVEVGNEVGLGIYIRNYEKLPGLPAEIAADAADPDRANVEGAATLEELALRIGVDPAVLVAEVEQYNAFVTAGDDAKFHKQAKYLLPILEGPFYAVKMETGIMISMGAMKIDDRWRAIGEDDQPIPGLYVVGCDAGGLWGESYSLPIPGSANGFSVTSGWLAADDIAERIAAGELGAVPVPA